MEKAKSKAQAEYEKVIQWVLDEEDKVTEELKGSGKYIDGLDTNSDSYAYIYAERNRRIAEIKKKYSIE